VGRERVLEGRRVVRADDVLVPLIFLTTLVCVVVAIVCIFVEAVSGHAVAFGRPVFFMLSVILLGATFLCISFEIGFYRREMRATALVFDVQREKTHGRGGAGFDLLFPQCKVAFAFEAAGKVYIFSYAISLPDVLRSGENFVHVHRRMDGPCGKKKVVVAYDKERPEKAEIVNSFHRVEWFLFMLVLSALGIWSSVFGKRKTKATAQHKDDRNRRTP
jgi:hypothetical protein